MIRYEIEDVDYWCGRCDSVMEETDCASAYCSHYRCLGCRHGCDIDLDDGLCAYASSEAGGTYPDDHLAATSPYTPAVRTAYAAKEYL